MSMPPPQGMSDFDFETIEAAVTETVRGRWFLNEFARRNRSAEGQATLEAISRLEMLVTAGQAALPAPPADPSVRLLVQRIKDIAGQLDGISRAMRQSGADDDLREAVDVQARALAGLMRGGNPSIIEPKGQDLKGQEFKGQELRGEESRRLEPKRLEPPMSERPIVHAITETPRAPEKVDPRLVILSGLDGLPLSKKLALFA